MGFIDNLKKGWNAFIGRDPTMAEYKLGPSYMYDGMRSTNRWDRSTDRTIVTAIYNRIAMDCAAITIKHVRVDYNDRFVDEMISGLNDCMNLEANTDQTGRAFCKMS